MLLSRSSRACISILKINRGLRRPDCGHAHGLPVGQHERFAMLVDPARERFISGVRRMARMRGAPRGCGAPETVPQRSYRSSSPTRAMPLVAALSIVATPFRVKVPSPSTRNTDTCDSLPFASTTAAQPVR
jgi:hypothetical protein